MIAILIVISILLFFIVCVLSAIKTELEKTRLENREIVNVLNKKNN
jgi:hypothetical protein